jgi:hypothetical protein
MLPPSSGLKCVVKTKSRHRYKKGMRRGRGKVGYSVSQHKAMEERALNQAWRKEEGANRKCRRKRP